jgi:hypothetical protein
MKLVKSLLLGSAAGLFAVAGAQAADLPVTKAAPVDYVRVCSTYGTGYFFLPGTDTCLRISGFLRAEYLYLEPFRRDIDATGFRARARLNFDFRQPTEYGLLRAFVRADLRRNTGTFSGSGQGALGAAPPFFGTSPADTAILDLGYIQFGGFTAGRVQSFYDFYANDNNYTTLLGVSDTKTQTFAYTATFGGGWSATLAVEDPQERRVVNNITGGSASTIIGLPTGFTFVDSDITALTVPQAFVPAGTRAPDVVANIRIDQSWGSAQLSAAAHQLRSANVTGRLANGDFFVSLPGAVPGGVGATPIDNPDDEWGYAIQGGVSFKLPMLAAGDQLWLQAAYASGALGYTHIDDATALRAGALRLNQTEAVVNPFTGDVEKTDSWSVSGNFLHYWTPNWRSNFFGAYSEIDFDDTASTLIVNNVAVGGIGATGTVLNLGFVDTRIYEAGANLIWTPVKQLDIGVEAVYRKIEAKGRVPDAFGPLITGTSGAGFVDPRLSNRSSEDIWEARLRVQRDF